MSFFLTPPRNTTTVRQLHGVLSNKDIAQLLSYVDTQPVHSGRLGDGRNDSEVRRSKVLFLPINKETKWIYNKVSHIVNGVNQRDFNFTLSAIQPMQYTEYHAADNGTYTDHLDWSPNVISPRKMSLSIQLSDDAEYEGGELQIKLTSHAPITASRTKGDALVFPSFLLHGVTPVTRGTRKSLVVWATGPEWQ